MGRLGSGGLRSGRLRSGGLPALEWKDCSLRMEALLSSNEGIALFEQGRGNRFRGAPGGAMVVGGNDNRQGWDDVVWGGGAATGKLRRKLRRVGRNDGADSTGWRRLAAN